MAANVVAAFGVLALLALGLFFWLGQPWGRLSDLCLLVATLGLAPLMLAFYELGGRTPTPLAQAAQATGWIAILVWSAAEAAVIVGAVTVDVQVAATGAFAVEAVALAVIGLWVAGANLLAGPWLTGPRWLGVAVGLEFVVFAVGLLLGGVNHPLTYVGGIGYQLGWPAWAFLMGRLLAR